jgi:hypothetical protein
VLEHLHLTQAEELERLEQDDHASHNRRRPIGVKPAYMPALSQGDRGHALEDPPALAGGQHVPLDRVGVAGLELPVRLRKEQPNRTIADSTSHFPIREPSSRRESPFVASEALAPDDEGQHGFRLSDPRQAEVRGWAEPALPTEP